MFDLTQLLSVSSPPITFMETAHYNVNGVRDSHNIVINEDTGFAYIVGSRHCSGGLHMVDIRDPGSPSYAGCFASDGYTHDAHWYVECGSVVPLK